MKLKRVIYAVIVAVLIALVFPFVASATTTSGTVSITHTKSGIYNVAAYTWISNADGEVLDDTLSIPAGELVRLCTNADATSAPTTLYDIDITDVDGFDILLGAGADRAAVNTESVFYGMAGNSGVVFSTTTLTQTVDTDSTYLPWRVPVKGKLTLVIVAAGATKAGIVRLYFKVRE